MRSICGAERDELVEHDNVLSNQTGFQQQQQQEQQQQDQRQLQQLQQEEQLHQQ
jgi:hypothetical protein